MIGVDLQMFGGRGGSSGGGAGKATEPILKMNTKFSAKQLSTMGRDKIATIAKAVFVQQNVARGLSATEALKRANMLLSGNTTPQLRKYIQKHGKAQG